ncbi:hypothetical protein E4U24_004138 [Claviceps purpurea]|nr:hypothetical protein E4U24_004138 [Claviceps purpurea]
MNSLAIFNTMPVCQVQHTRFHPINHPANPSTIQPHVTNISLNSSTKNRRFENLTICTVAPHTKPCTNARDAYSPLLPAPPRRTACLVSLTKGISLSLVQFPSRASGTTEQGHSFARIATPSVPLHSRAYRYDAAQHVST